MPLALGTLLHLRENGETFMLRTYFSAAALAAGLGMSCAYAAPNSVAGVVFSSSNAASTNAVLVYSRAVNGTLTALNPVPTGGRGTGAGLGDQGAVALGDDGGLLAVVNAGSNDFTLFAVEGTQLTQLSKTASNGLLPISVAIYGDLIYVLNQGSDQISGFRIGSQGTVTAIQGSSRLLSGTGVGAAQVSFSPDGKYIVVTEKNTSKIDVFGLDENGLPSATAQTIAAGATTPFGFGFSGNHTLVVSDAASPDSVQSYHLLGNGTLTADEAPVLDNQAATCWIAVTPGGKYAYAADAGSAFISGLSVGAGGVLTLQSTASISTPGASPHDEATDAEGRYLYVLDTRGNTILAFTIAADGSLQPLGTPVPGVPASVSGLAAQ